MRRVVITGMGLVSPLGDDLSQVLSALQEGRSGVTFQPAYEKLGLRSCVGAFTQVNPEILIDKKTRRFMGNAAAYGQIAMAQAIEDAGLIHEQVAQPRTGLIIGSGGTSAANVVTTADTVRNRGPRRLSPFMVPRTMSSTVSAVLASSFGIQGVCYSLSSACATGSHCIGAAMEQILLGKQDLVFAGGADEEHWTQSCMFDSMGALSSHFNAAPAQASRPYDRDRDGFVVANGGGVVVVEELSHAKARGAKIYGELIGYGATSDGQEVVSPSGEGAVRCMQIALEMAKNPVVDYINAHGTATPVGDIVELQAIRQVFGQACPSISSTKSLSGHALGAAGVHETIYSLLMLNHDFIAASANIDNIDPQAVSFPLVLSTETRRLTTVLSNSYGFGGTNCCLIFNRYQG